MIARAMQRIPRLGKGWRYLPIYDFPEGTEIEIKLKPVDPAHLEGFKLMDLNHPRKRCDNEVLALPAGVYRFRVGIRPKVHLIHPDGTETNLALYSWGLAPSGRFEGNFERKRKKRQRGETKNQTIRLTSGEIESIVVVGTRYRLNIQDVEPKRYPKKRNKRPFWRKKRNLI